MSGVIKNQNQNCRYHGWESRSWRCCVGIAVPIFRVSVQALISSTQGRPLNSRRPDKGRVSDRADLWVIHGLQFEGDVGFRTVQLIPWHLHPNRYSDNFPFLDRILTVTTHAEGVIAVHLNIEMVYTTIQVVNTLYVDMLHRATAVMIHKNAPLTDHIEPHESTIADAVDKQAHHHQQNRTITKQARPQNAPPTTRNGIFGCK